MVKIADFLPQKRDFNNIEDTWALISPPTFRIAKLRSAVVGKGRTVNVSNTRISTGSEANVAALFAQEIWWTYEDTNLEVELPLKIGEDGEVEEWEKIVFAPRADEKQRDFLNKVDRLPLYIVYDWHNQVVDVIPEWQLPF